MIIPCGTDTSGPVTISLYKYPGIESSPVSHTERLVSALGGTLVIACVFFINWYATIKTGNAKILLTREE
jgi:hypothetical protein